MTLRPFGITRLIFFGLIILCALSVLALVFSINSLINDLLGNLASELDGSVHISNTRNNWTVGHWAIGASAATLGTLIPLLILDLIRTWSLVAIELVILAGLWAGWIISASKTTTEYTATHCEQAALISAVFPSINTICQRYEAFLIFSWTTFGLILVYTILLVTLAIRARKQGHKFAWFRSASSLAFFPQHTYDDKVNRV